MSPAPTIWVDGWFASSAAAFLRLIKADLPDARIIYSHNKPDPAAVEIADLWLPRPEGDPAEIALEVGATHGVDVLVAVRNLTHLVRSRERFAEVGMALAVPAPTVDAIAAMEDKAEIYRVCDLFGLAPTPRWQSAGSPADLLDSVRSWADAGETCCMKPAVGEGAQGFRIIDPSWNPSSELFTWPSVYLAPRDLRSLLEGLDALDDRFPRMLVSDYLPGLETSVDVVSEHGEVRATIVRRKETSTRQSIVRDEEVEQAALAMSRHWGLHGCWNAQFRADEAGRPQLLEVNPRPAAGSVHVAGLGINMPALAVRLALGQSVATVVPPSGCELQRRVVVDIEASVPEPAFDTRGAIPTNTLVD